MARSKILLTMGAAIILSACAVLQPPAGTDNPANVVVSADDLPIQANAPTPVGTRLSGQREVQGAQHWFNLARDLAEGLTQASDRKPGNRSIFIDPPDQGMPFAKAFHGHLVTNLLARGFAVTTTRGDADRVHISIQPVHHEYLPNKPPPGVISAVAFGAWAVDYFSGNIAPAIFGAVLAEGVNGLPYLRTDAFSEIILTVSVVRGGDLTTRLSTAFYVDNRELPQYLRSRPEPPLIVQASGADKVSLPVRTFRVVSRSDIVQ